MGAKPDLEIMGFLAREMGAAAALGPWTPEAVFEEIRKRARLRYRRRMRRRRGADTPVNGASRGTGRSGAFDHNGLFASGTLGRYSKVLNSVVESRLDR